MLKKPAAQKKWQPKEYYPIPRHVPYVVAKLPKPCQDVGEGGVFQHLEYGICRQSMGEKRSNRDQFGGVKSWQNSLDNDDRPNLSLKLYWKHESYHVSYHRIVGLTLLSCYWDDQGRLLRKAKSVEPDDHAKYQVHHIDGDVLNVSIRNLAVVTLLHHKKLTAGSKLCLPKVWPYL